MRRLARVLIPIPLLLAARPAAADATGALDTMGRVTSEPGTWGLLSFTIGPSFTDFQGTDAFSGLPGAPGDVSAGAWSVGVLYASSGKAWMYLGANRLQFGTTAELDDGATLHRTFGLELPFAVGPDVARALGSEDFGFAPALSLLAKVGPKYELTVADGGKLSFASVAVPIAPGALIAIKPAFWASVGYAPHPAFIFAHVTGTEGSGSLAEYRPPQAPPTSQTFSVDVNGLRPKTMLFGTVALVHGFFGLRVNFHRTQFEFSDSTPGWNDGFVEQEIDASIGFGYGGDFKFMQ